MLRRLVFLFDSFVVITVLVVYLTLVTVLAVISVSMFGIGFFTSGWGS